MSFDATLSTGSALPAWLAFDAVTRTFTGTLPFDEDNDPGELTIRVVAQDPAGEWAEAFFTLTLAEHPRPWQNAVNPMDVNPGGGVVALDVLQLINYINTHGTQKLNDPGFPLSPPPYVDVNGDGNPTAQDVLLVINYINNQLAGGGAQAEGEPGGIVQAMWDDSPSRRAVEGVLDSESRATFAVLCGDETLSPRAIGDRMSRLRRDVAAPIASPRQDATDEWEAVLEVLSRERPEQSQAGSLRHEQSQAGSLRHEQPQAGSLRHKWDATFDAAIEELAVEFLG